MECFRGVQGCVNGNSGLDFGAELDHGVDTAVFKLNFYCCGLWQFHKF